MISSIPEVKLKDLVVPSDLKYYKTNIIIVNINRKNVNRFKKNITKSQNVTKRVTI